ncbi:hypothetical protein N7457_003513 [Penicillium paradoxum]|uniref:uncharacterized protein n=1 Tax=Penicillium paradoxum TaxID=176176 RepID=UPI0025497575|nr:uncharacterized protein N7457_003513 [Penicillium paradoxum]KAJ5788523.1 hypothetical protein N7457_003513 [Penicillium paradoxum]
METRFSGQHEHETSMADPAVNSIIRSTYEPLVYPSTDSIFTALGNEYSGEMNGNLDMTDPQLSVPQEIIDANQPL